MLVTLLGRFQRLLVDMGWPDTLLYLVARAVRKISCDKIEVRKYYFVSQPIPKQQLLPANRGSSIVVEHIGPHHPLVGKFPRPPDVITRRFRNDALCFLATKNGQFIGFLWLQRGCYLEDEVRGRFIPMPAEQAVWDFDVHVEPDHRNSFAFARLWDVANQFLRDIGVAWTVSRISAFNPGSINSHARLGAFPVACAYFLCGHRWQFLLSGSRPYLHFSSGEESVPELRLPADSSNRKHYWRFAGKSAVV